MSQPLAAGSCQRVEMRVPSVTGSLPLVRAVVEKMIESAASDETSAQVGLAIDEALANVIRHAYDGAPDKTIDLAIRVTEHATETELHVAIRHYGKQVDPATIKSRRLEDVRPGGLGVHIIESVMDRVSYECAPDGGMKIELTKHLSKPQA